MSNAARGRLIDGGPRARPRLARVQEGPCPRSASPPAGSSSRSPGRHHGPRPHGRGGARAGAGEARLAERPHPHRAPRRGRHGPGRHRDGAQGARGRARGRRRHLRRPLRGVPEEVRQGPPDDARLPRGPRPQGRGRGDRGEPRPLAHADDDRRPRGGQGRLLREADDALDRRGRPHARGAEEDRAHPAGGQPVRELDRLREGPRALRLGRHRQGQPDRGLDEPQLGDGRPALADPEGRLAADDRLGPLPRQRPEAAVRAGAPLPLAALQRLRHRHHRRPLRAPVLGDALRHRRPRPVAASSARAACATGRTAARSRTSWSRSSTTRPAARRRPSTSPSR